MNRIRITGGEWRSRLIQVVDVPGLRPTPDRVRETLFNWLGHDLDGLACLDLFAGSGILGFEAASRGAARVMFVEQDARALAALKRNAIVLEDARLEIVRGDAVKSLAALAGQAGRFDLLFLDPPYRQGWLDRLWPLLPPVLTEDARVYVEAEHALAAPVPWRVVRQGKAGQVFYHLLERS